MLLLKEVYLNHEGSTVSCTYTPSVKTYNIITENMNDDNKPVQFGNGCCIWLNEKGQIGEAECIYPKLLDEKGSFYEQPKVLNEGTPSFIVTSFDADVTVEPIENGFIIWFTKEKRVEQEISQDRLSYLLLENKLVGLVAKNVGIIE
ncbi:hypothetical protein [Paenibacillus phocaensis]|uniref:hypothetical protein n=1 Tax=Paenibacillus phocaensis TaxID=1776378 RepID=UPI000399DCCE|nr:hypothetical protein [Paenibacillus phocaensis]